MNEAPSILISPFAEVWQSLTNQANAWTMIYTMLNQSLRLPSQLAELKKSLKANEIGDLPSEFINLLDEANVIATDAANLFSLQKKTIVYPMLISAWAIVEASLDDLIIRILINDPEAPTKLTEAKIKTSDTYQTDREAWAKKTYIKVEAKAKEKAKGRVIETHKSSFNIFGIVFEYPADRACVIEELNQARNCILHNQGVIDEKAVEICPRFAPYLGSPIPPEDPLFNVTGYMLGDYILAWIAALVHSPYLSNSLKDGVANPFSTSDK